MFSFFVLLELVAPPRLVVTTITFVFFTVVRSRLPALGFNAVFRFLERCSQIFQVIVIRIFVILIGTFTYIFFWENQWYDYFKLKLQFQSTINYADLASNKKLLISHLLIVS